MDSMLSLDMLDVKTFLVAPLLRFSLRALTPVVVLGLAEALLGPLLLLPSFFLVFEAAVDVLLFSLWDEAVFAILEKFNDG